MSKEAEDWLANYLNTISLKDWPRIVCCNSSRGLYCPQCCKLLIPKEDWPGPIQDGSLELPFDMDIILDDQERRASATGLHIISISEAMEACRDSEDSQDNKRNKIQLFDIQREPMPSYESANDGVYVLFPGKDSLPISDVGPIKKLIVLDCKWSRTKVKMHENVASLPRVHLVNPPAESHFWRWHNSGNGMLSTMEAIYFSAWQAAEDWPMEKRRELVHVMWLFALQRSLMAQRSITEKRPPPFTEDGKNLQRSYRRRQEGNPPKSRGSVRQLKQY